MSKKAPSDEQVELLRSLVGADAVASAEWRASAP
jgi:hypothetical protein